MKAKGVKNFGLGRWRMDRFFGAAEHVLMKTKQEQCQGRALAEG